MKFSKHFHYIFFFTTFFVTSQNTTINKKIAINNSIAIQIKKATSLTYDYKYNEALMLIHKSIKQSDSLKNDSLLGKSYLVYGIINTYLGKRKQAILNQRKAEVIFKKTKNYKYLGSVYNNIGWTYSNNLKNIDSIIIYYKKALDAYTLAKSHKRITTALNNLGYNYILIGEYDKAEALLKKSLYLYKKHIKTSEKQYLSEIYLSLCELYLKKNELKKALVHANLAEKEVLKNKYERNSLEVYELKSKIYGIKGNYKKSLIYLKKYHKLLLKTHKNERSRVAHETAAKFEVEDHENYLEKAVLENSFKEEKLKKSKLLTTIVIILFLIAFFTAFLLYRNNKLKSENNKLLISKHKQLKDLQLKTELFFLKTQIQPHFFFNTLNNLYALIIEKSEKANDVVIKLSELMKYTLYGAKMVIVPIKEEIKNIENYLELENLRYEKTALSAIKITGKIDHITVPPLLFITFIENCFKHNNVNDENFKLNISLKNKASKHLLFKVQNTIIARFENKKEQKKGVGIENAKRRLMLIYRNKYDLKISTKNNNFSVELKIPIQN